MNEIAIFQQILFKIGSKTFTVGHFTAAFMSIALIFVLYHYIVKPLLRNYFIKQKVEAPKAKSIRRLIQYIFLLLACIAFLWSMDLDYILYSTDYENSARNVKLRISTIIGALLVLQIARVFDWVISRVIEKSYEKQHKEDLQGNLINEKVLAEKTTAGKTVQYFLYTLFAILFIRAANLDYELIHYANSSLTVTSILIAILFLLAARLVVFIITELVLFSYFNNNKVNVGSRFAMNQLVKYVVFVVAFLMAINALGVNLTVLLGAGAALLVGIGFALQQTFNDFFSGIILLFERTVEVGDVIVIEGVIGTVKRIGLRTTIVESRSNTTVVVPNSKIVSNNMVNWTHYDDKVRFELQIGVAYGTDTQKVKDILLELTRANPYILKYPGPMIRFVNFGESSLDFEILFWSRNFIVIEDIKSDLRFAIDKAFKEHEIEIPFPQRVIWRK